MSRLTWDRTVEPISTEEVLRRERGQGKVNFACLADHEQDSQPYPVDPYYAEIANYTTKRRWRKDRRTKSVHGDT